MQDIRPRTAVTQEGNMTGHRAIVPDNKKTEHKRGNLRFDHHIAILILILILIVTTLILITRRRLNI